MESVIRTLMSSEMIVAMNKECANSYLMKSMHHGHGIFKLSKKKE